MMEVYEFTKVTALAENFAMHVVSFNTDKGKKCWIQDEGPGKVDIQFIRRAAKEGTVVFVAYDSTTGLCHFAAPFTKDHVDLTEFVQEPQPSLRVRLVLRPSFLFLLSVHPRFEELRKILDNAKGKDQVVWVGAFPGDSTILDVRLATP
jgi:hypothetical protein